MSHSLYACRYFRALCSLNILPPALRASCNVDGSPGRRCHPSFRAPGMPSLAVVSRALSCVWLGGQPGDKGGSGLCRLR